MLLETINLFLYLFLKLSILFLGISFIVYLLQSFISKEKIQNALGQKGIKRYIFALLLGSITPFCSCSTIPMLKGFINAKVNFGTMMAFLITSPLLNPLIIGVLIATFGLNITIVYVGMSIFIALFASILLEKMRFENYIIENTISNSTKSSCSVNLSNKINKIDIIKKSWNSAYKDYKKLFFLLMFGIAVGALTYGFVPSEFIAKYAGSNNPLAILIASVIGIPLYISITAMIPLAAVLITKGMGMGAVIALVIGSAGASLTEVILLKSLFKTKLIIAFLIIVLAMAITTGFVVDIFFS